MRGASGVPRGGGRARPAASAPSGGAVGRRGSSRPPGPTENTVGRPGAHLELPLHGGTRSLEDLLHSTGNLRADSVTCGREGHRRGGALGPGGHLRPPRFLRAHAMGPSRWAHYRSRGRACHNIRAAPPILLTGAIAAASSTTLPGRMGCRRCGRKRGDTRDSLSGTGRNSGENNARGARVSSAALKAGESVRKRLPPRGFHGRRPADPLTPPGTDRPGLSPRANSPGKRVTLVLPEANPRAPRAPSFWADFLSIFTSRRRTAD